MHGVCMEFLQIFRVTNSERGWLYNDVWKHIAKHKSWLTRSMSSQVQVENSTANR